MERWDKDFGYNADVKNVGGDAFDIRVEKDTMYFHLMDDWMTLKEYDVNLSSYFKEHKLSNVAIYGMGIIASHLIMELKKGGTEIKYAIDRGARHMMDVIPIKSLYDEWPAVDVVVVTVIYDFEHIKTELEKKIKCPIVSLREVVDYMMKSRR